MSRLAYWRRRRALSRHFDCTRSRPRRSRNLFAPFPLLLLALAARSADAPDRFAPGHALRSNGRFEEAADFFQRERAARADHPTTLPVSSRDADEARDRADAALAWATTLLDLRRPHLAEPLARDALSNLASAYPNDDWHFSEGQRVLGRCILDLGRLDEAEPIIRSAHEKLAASSAPVAIRAEAAGDWAEVLMIRGMINLAEPLFLSAIDDSYSDLSTPLRRFQHRRLIEKLVRLFDSLDRPDDAAGWRAIIESIDSRPPHPPQTQPARG